MTQQNHQIAAPAANLVGTESRADRRGVCGSADLRRGTAGGGNPPNAAARNPCSAITALQQLGGVIPAEGSAGFLARGAGAFSSLTYPAGRKAGGGFSGALA